MSAGLGELTHPKQIASEVYNITDLSILKYAKFLSIFKIDIIQVFALASLARYIPAIIDIEETLAAI